jgi:hypothetical protein
MGITQQIGASSLIRPGVIDNAAARPASPYEGQAVYQKDTDQVFIYNGSAWKQIPTAATAGTVLQTVEGRSTTQVANATQSFVDTGISATITPSATTSKILVIATTPVYMADSACEVRVNILRASTEISVNIQNDSSGANAHQTSSMVILDSPSTTSATTYKTQFRNGAASKTSYVMNASQFGSIVLMEIAG